MPLSAYLRRTRNVEELLPWLYLKGVSTGQFEEALAALLGPEAPGLSAATVRRLTEAWQEEHARWRPPGTRTAGLIQAGLARLLRGVGPPGFMLAISRKSDLPSDRFPRGRASASTKAV